MAQSQSACRPHPCLPFGPQSGSGRSGSFVSFTFDCCVAMPAPVDIPSRPVGLHRGLERGGRPPMSTMAGLQKLPHVENLPSFHPEGGPTWHMVKMVFLLVFARLSLFPMHTHNVLGCGPVKWKLLLVCSHGGRPARNPPPPDGYRFPVVPEVR